MKASLGYVRVSTMDQAERGVSIDNQKERIAAYCKYKGFELTEIIEDAGVSGGLNKTREGFISLLDRIEQGGVEAVILYSLERLSRDMLTLLALERYFNEHDVELHTVEGQIDASTPDGWTSFAIRSFSGEIERRQVKYRTKKAMEYKKRRNEVVGSIPYGYRREGKGLLPDLTEQAIIKTVNTLYSQDARLMEIVGALNEQGKRTRGGRPWTPTQVKRLISEYAGSWKKSHTLLSVATRQFIEAIA